MADPEPIRSELHPKLLAADMMNTHVEVLMPGDDLADAMVRFGRQEAEKLPVVDALDSMQCLGIVRLADVLRAVM